MSNAPSISINIKWIKNKTDVSSDYSLKEKRVYRLDRRRALVVGLDILFICLGLRSGDHTTRRFEPAQGRHRCHVCAIYPRERGHTDLKEKKKTRCRLQDRTCFESTQNRGTWCLDMVSYLLERRAGHTLAEAHEIPRTAEDVHGVRLVGKGGLHVKHKLNIINTTQVARTRGL